MLGAMGVNTYPIWQRASLAFAAGAQGAAMTFGDGAGAASVFINIELPILLSNGNQIIPGR
jgi:hypothetical protein